MKRLSDESGWIRVVVCFIVLLTHHGLRDAFLTGLPTLAASDITIISTLTSTPVTPTDPITTSDSTYSTDDHENIKIQARTVSYPFRNKKSDSTKLLPESSEYKVLKRNGSTRTGFIGSKPPLFVLRSGLSDNNGKITSHRNNDVNFISENNGANFIPESENNLSGRDETSEATKTDETIYETSEATKTNETRYETSEATKTDETRYETNEATKTDETRYETNEATKTNETTYETNEATKTDETRYETNKATKTDETRRETVLNGSLIDILRRVVSGVGFDGVINEGDPGVRWWDPESFMSGSDAEDEGLDSDSLLKDIQQIKDDWSLVLEGLVLSSVYWGCIFTHLLADTIMDRVGVVLVMAVSLGSSGLVGLLTHAASLWGPWAVLGLRVLQGILQGVCYPAVVRVLEGVPPSIRASGACLVFLGPCVGTSVGAVLASLTPWYISLYVLGALALLLGPLCLLLPRPPLSTPHKNMCWKKVLSSRGVMACVCVHVANTWMLHTLLLGLSICLIYTHMEEPITSGWVLSSVCVVVCVVVRLNVLVASKLDGNGPSTVLNRRRIPVLTGTVLVCVGVIVMSTVGLDSLEVLVGVGLGLGGVGVGVTRVGYRLNVDDMVPLEGWRVTKVLDVAALITAAISPIVLTALAQIGTEGWIAVWLVPLALLIPAAIVHMFLLTSNQQTWDKAATDRSNGVTGNGAAGGNVTFMNGIPPPLSVGRQSFKSARSALTFKTAHSRSRTRTLSCRTIDDDLDGDMHSVANSNVDYQSVADDAEKDCVSVASSSTFKSDGGDLHSVIDEGFDGVAAASVGKQGGGGYDFGSILTHSGNTDRTSAWLCSHHDLVITNIPQQTTNTTTTRAQAHANNSIYGLLW